MSKRIVSVALCVGLWPAAASADVCPDDARYATNGAGQAFCLFENITLPEADDVAAYCHWLELGYVGFSWTQGPASASYACPAGSTFAGNGAGTGFCLYADLDLPEADNLTPYCHWLEYGYIGYHWDICPAGARYATNGASSGFCLFEGIELPAANDVAPYCDYLEDGYLGYSWTENPQTLGYTCPDGSRYADNGHGLGFCLFEDVWLPPNEGLAPYCHWLEYGYLGYSWDL